MLGERYVSSKRRPSQLTLQLILLIKLQVTEEVRTAFQAESDINFTTAPSRLTYMQACLDEALRLYPPAPFLSPRLTPPGITEIAGHQVPGGVSLPFPIRSKEMLQ